MLLLQFQRATFFLFLITPSYWILTIEAISKTGRNRKSDGHHAATTGATAPHTAAGAANSSRLAGLGLGSTDSAYGYNAVSGVGSDRNKFPNVPVDNTKFCLRRREMKLLCYCTPDDESIPVFKAECWIFVEGLLASDPTWTRFWQQKRIRELKIVVQRHGFLDYIPVFIFDALRNITIFSIEYAQIERVRTGSFASLALLERVYLANNMIIYIEEYAFHTLIRLTEINLEYNQLCDIHAQSFRNLPLMERLFLQHNNITQLYDGIFSHMPRLLKLDISNNLINVLSSEAFKGLGNLHTLNLSNNLVSHIPDTVFTELWSLTILNLGDNKIQRIAERAFDGLNNLRTLNLRGNQLKALDHGVFRGTPALRSVNLEGNKIDNLPAAPLNPIIDNIVNTTDGALFLADNNFVCDCRLNWLLNIHNRSFNPQPRAMVEQIYCTLESPKIEQFVLPIPRNILNFLNVTTQNAIIPGEEIINNNNMLRKQQLQQQQQPRQRQNPRKNRQRNEEFTAGDMQTLNTQRKKRNSPVYAPASASSLDNFDYVESSADESMIMMGSSLLADYYEDHRNLGNGVDIFRNTNKDVLLGNDLESATNSALDADLEGNGTDVTEKKPHKPEPFHIKVRLLALKPEGLQCPLEYLDPTELPLPRDLMDGRRNNTADAFSRPNYKKTFAFVFAVSAFEFMLRIG